MSEYSNSATVQLIGFGGRFWRWARSCIDALVSDLAGAAGAGGRGMLIVADAASTTLLGRLKDGARQSLGALQNSGGLPQGEQLRQLGRLAHGEAALRLGAGKAVVARIALPAAALEVLPAVIRNKVESLAPWPLAEALWGYKVVEGSGNGQVAVDVGIVSRRTLDAFLAALSAAGLKVTQLEITDNTSAGQASVIPVDFTAEDRDRRARNQLWLAIGVAGLLAVCVAAYGLYLAFAASGELGGLQARIDTLQQALQGKRGDSGDPKLAAANQLFDRKRDTPAFIVMIDDLTKLVPDGTWLTSLGYDGKRFTLSGHGNETPKLVEILEKSPTFSDVNFAAATQRDPDGRGEAFSLSAAVESKAVPQ